MDEKMELSEKIQKEIEAKVGELKAKNPKLKRVYPIYVFGDEEDEKEIYVGYFRQPSFVAFSKFMSISQQDQAGAMKVLAKDCFLDGDKELVDDEALFLYGLFPYLKDLIQTRQGGLVNFTKSGK